MRDPNTSTPLIYPKTAAETVRFSLSKCQVPARLTASVLAGAEVVTLKAVDGEGAAEATTSIYRDGIAVSCKATDPVLVIDAPGMYEAAKPVTAGASGLYLAKGS